MFQNLNYELQKRLSDVLSMPCNKVVKSDRRSSLAPASLHEDKLCDTLQAMTSTNNVKTVNQTSLLHIISRATSIDSDCCHLPMASVLSNKAHKSRFNLFSFLPLVGENRPWPEIIFPPRNLPICAAFGSRIQGLSTLLARR